jgi:hypothetical protein
MLVDAGFKCVLMYIYTWQNTDRASIDLLQFFIVYGICKLNDLCQVFVHQLTFPTWPVVFFGDVSY